MKKPKIAKIHLTYKGGLWTWRFTNWGSGHSSYRCQSVLDFPSSANCIYCATAIAKRCGFDDARVTEVIMEEQK